jgi:hypothetical protein
MTSSWSGRYEAFWHDWLKNCLLPALASYKNIMAGEVQDSTYERHILQEVLPKWEKHFAEGLALVRDYPSEMSPRRWMEQGPLRVYEQHSFLGDLMHELWLFRHAVPCLLLIAGRRLEAADTAYQSLQKALAAGGTSGARSDTARDEFERFYIACRRLSRAFARLPRGVLVV